MHLHISFDHLLSKQSLECIKRIGSIVYVVPRKFVVLNGIIVYFTYDIIQTNPNNFQH